jgi:hypothetical protein
MDFSGMVEEAARYYGERSMPSIPSEFSIGGVFLPPLMIVAILGVVAASVTAALLNRFRLARFFYYPPLVYVALAVLYTGLISNLVLPV